MFFIQRNRRPCLLRCLLVHRRKETPRGKFVNGWYRCMVEGKVVLRWLEDLSRSGNSNGNHTDEVGACAKKRRYRWCMRYTSDGAIGAVKFRSRLTACYPISRVWRLEWWQLA